MSRRIAAALVALAAVTAVLGYAACGGPAELDLLPPGPEGGIEGGAADSGADAGPDACMNGPCPCGLSPCSGGCFDLQNDPSHCGSCAGGCSHEGYCSGGQCTCLPGLQSCSGVCADLASNADNCRGCGTACDAGQSCEMGCHAAGGTCPAGLTPCPVSGSRFSCVDLDASLPYCGSCGTVCAPSQLCAGGQCQRYAPATPCAACPCAGCDMLVGAPSVCCSGIGGGATPICVQGVGCP